MRRMIPALAAVLLAAGTASAQNNPLEPSWELNPESSTLQFQSVKKGSVVETSEFATFSGGIDPTGLTTIKVVLDSVDTKVDLRNVRMRFLFFETFLHPEATVTARISPSDVADLANARRKTVPVTFELDLHGIKKQLETDVVATLITDDTVSVASAAPIVVSLEDFNLIEGMNKLQDAANVTITPSGSVSFDFVFNRIGGPVEQQVAAIGSGETRAAQPATVDEEFTLDACMGRFEILSQANAVYFNSGSARLSNDSSPLLTQVVDIINKCPELNIVVEGHTDSIGGEELNQTLSEARAASVAAYLVNAGIPDIQITSIGYGETRPVADNDTDRNRARNRRIQFAVSAPTEDAAALAPENLISEPVESFASPVKQGSPEIIGKSLAELVEGNPLYAPVEGIPEELWNGQQCSNCHQWTQQALCDQGNFYATNGTEFVSRKEHPYGGTFKTNVRLWAENGCL